MRIDVILIAAGALVLSAVLTRVVLWFAFRHDLLDHPNERSSHTTPTARGGGIAIVIASAIGLLLLGMRGAAERPTDRGDPGRRHAVAIAGFIDDRRGIPQDREAAGACSCQSLVALSSCLAVLPAIRVRRSPGAFWVGRISPRDAGNSAWVLNLFNFMDGIDGIAAAEALFMCRRRCALLSTVSASAITRHPMRRSYLACSVSGLPDLELASSARIFMGDVGSGYLGYVIAVLAYRQRARQSRNAAVVADSRGRVFLRRHRDADATTDSRERAHEAHRSHAYQWLARRWRSHSRVTIATAVINLCWLLPCALFAARHPRFAAWTTGVAWTPVALLVLFTGAGRAET
jgi:Fuc2NAc and GlcNAc transferase